MANGIFIHFILLFFVRQHLSTALLSLFPTPYNFQLTFSSPTVIIDMVEEKKASQHSVPSTLIKKLFVSLTNVMCHRISTQSSTHYWVSMSRYLARRVRNGTRSEKEKNRLRTFAAVALMRFHRRVVSPLLELFSLLSLRVDYLLAMCESH